MPNWQDQNRTTLRHIIIKTLSTENKEKILKAARRKCQVMHEGKLIKITDFSTKTIKGRKAWNEVSQVQKKK
jgi:hypothetical protein